MPAVESVRGGAVRLFQPTDRLGIAEGIETAIATHELFGLPTWATISSTIRRRIARAMNTKPWRNVRRASCFSWHDGALGCRPILSEARSACNAGSIAAVCSRPTGHNLAIGETRGSWR
jgi:hypothetical protein